MLSWLERKVYLPPIMRDFHDQKMVFKLVDAVVRNAQISKPNDHLLKDLPSWINAHVYVIDFFLWFMAKRGYTLQRK